MATEFFTLEAVPARYGDCLLLHYGTADQPGLSLIDGGPDQVWKPLLEKRLAAIQKRRGDGFQIDLLMVSHIDDDHVLGILDFTTAWLAAKSAGEKWPYRAKQAWFNSFERISNAKNLGAVTASVTASTGASTLHDVDVDRPEITNPNKDEARAGLKVLASVNNGSKLRKDLEALRIPTNAGFAGNLVRPGAGPSIPFKLGPELTLHVVAPLPKQLEKLQLKFAKDLKPEEALAAYTDGSVPNLSSIAAVARYKGKTILLTGDARGDYLIQGLKDEGLLAEGGTLHFDILKMPHHGSDRNVDPSFFTTLTADHYVASADGTFGNPDRPTLEMLIDRRGKTAKYTIHLTYPLAQIDARRKEVWESKSGNPPWNGAKDDLAALFAAKKAEGFEFTVSAPAAAGQSETVQLLGPIPF
ncbi:MAG: hypothetical protein QOG72_906 [Sphingomonadales bacterium]|jgi:hypothetical protein|nr:hypothetical protein [Sphingomonadales bacterium]